LKNGAGGKFGVSGDYLYRTFMSSQFNGGIWGSFRVLPTGLTRTFECLDCTPTKTTDGTTIP
jgi:hypothetical protein